MTRILLIEDHAQMRDNISLILELNGFEVATAENGRIGVERAFAEPPDVILCDVMMPELDGHGVLAKLRSNPALSAIPFIFLTAKGEKHDLRTGMNLGADDYLTKPVAESDLLTAIRIRLARNAAIGKAAGGPDFSSHEPLKALGLTDREAEVLLWIAQGKSNGDIGIILGMTEATAKKHVSNLLDKLGHDSRHAAAMQAIEVLSGRAA